MWEKRTAYRVMMEKPGNRGHLKGPGKDGSIILVWIFKKYDLRA
jgi:hypothetical protein